MLLQLLLYPSVSIFGSGAAVGAFGASVANYAAKSSLDAAYIQHDCDDIPFDEIKEVLDVRFSKVDKDLDVSSSTLKLISQMVGENTSIIEETRAAVYKGFDNVLNSIKNSRTGPTISKLDNFIQYFMSEKKVIMNLPHDQYIAKVEEQNGVLFNLRDSRTTKADSLNTLLYDIINQKYAIPEDLNDKAAFYALYSLYYGTQSYVSVMYFLLEQYSYLADYHYQNGDMKEYNKYFDLTQIIFRDFQHSLIGVTSNGISLIDNVVNVFNEVKNKKFIKSKEDLFDLLSQRIESLTDVKFRLQGMKLPMIVDVPGKLIGRPTFTESIVTTPIGKWEDGAKVSYAVQYKYNDTRSKVGEWSDQLTINGKANPLLKVPVDSKRRTRLIFRKFNDDKPQLVGVLESRYQTDFKDLDRDLYNAASRFDENVAMREIGILIRNGANINAAFDKERRAIHAAAQSGNIQLVQDVLLRNNATDINVKDSDGYTPMHIAAQVGNEGFIDLLIGRGADVNAKTSLRKLTPLHIAAYKGYVSAVEILMKSDGIDVNAREKEDFSPLHSAVIGGVPVVQALLSNSDVDVNARSHDGLTPLHLSSIHNYLDVAEALLEGNEVDINAMANGNLTALHLASLIGNLEMVKFLAARNGIDVNKKSIEGWVPLHFAVAFKNGNVVAELLNINSINVNAVGKDNIIPLHLAAITGQKSIVLSLLEKGVKIDEKTKDGLTALHLATANDKREVIFTLIDRGAKIDEKTVDGFTPLHFATQNGYLELVKYFVDEKGVDFHITDNSRRTPLQVTDQLEIVKYFIEEKKASYEHCIFDVVERGRLNILSYLIAKGADINKQGSFGNTLLHIAILGGNLDIVKCLIEKKADVNIKNNEDWTPLYVAAKYGRLDIVKYLAENGANINEKNELSNTPLYIAIEHGHLAIVKYLTKKGGYVSEKENVDITPLYVATEFNHLDIVEYLVNEGANINEKDKWGNTPLHVAAEFGRLDMVEYFIEKGASIDEQNETGGTPLYVAVVNNRLNIVKCLIKKGADINVKNSEDHTPMYMAAKLGRLDIVRYFIEEVSSVNQQNEWGSTSLHAAIVNNRLNIVKYFIEERGEDVNKQNRVGITPLYVAATHNRLDIVKYFIVKGANVNIKNSEGHTPLYTAAKFGHLNIVKCLIEEKADVNVKDSNDHTSLHIAAQIGRLDIVEYLIEKKADVNVKDSNGHTPLHIAAKFGRLNVVEYLTKEGASVDIKDNNGHTPLDIANKFGHSDIVEYLKSKGTSRSRRSIESKELPKEIESSSYDYNTFVSDDLLESNKIEYNRENNNQAASGASKPSSWINDSFGWVKSSVGELLSSKPEGNTSSISQVNTQIDVNSTITLLNVLIRKVTGQQRFISSVDQSISPLEAQDCALNIIEEFEKVVNQAALKNGISMHRLNIDYVEMKKEVTAKIMSGKFNDIPEILNSYVEKACPGIEAGCPDKLSSKKFDKFMVEFNKRLDIALAQQQILNNSVSTLEVNNIKEQQINLEPQSYLSNTSIQGHLTQDKAKLVS